MLNNNPIALSSLVAEQDLQLLLLTQDITICQGELLYSALSTTHPHQPYTAPFG